MPTETPKITVGIGALRDRPADRRQGTSIAVLSAVLGASMASAERLPVQGFNINNGLAGNSIHNIVRDSRGFLWFCTSEGLSRFDGYQFVNFGSPALPGRDVRHFVESRDSGYWVATANGLVELRSTGAAQSRVVETPGEPRSRNVHAIKQTLDGTLWVGTDSGLYRVARDRSHLEPVSTGPLPETWSEPSITTLAEDGDGNLWFGGHAGIARLMRGGRVDRWTPRHGFPSYVVEALARDDDGTIWAGTEQGLCHMLARPRAGDLPVERCYDRRDGLPSPYIQSILRTSAGYLWVGTLEGAAWAPPGNSNLRFTPLTVRQGLTDNNIEALVEDGESNIWLGAASDGAMRLSQARTVLYTEDDGLDAGNVVGVIEDRQGVLYSLTRSAGRLSLHRFDGGRFVRIPMLIPNSVRGVGRGFQQIALQDSDARWWVATGDGLLSYPPGSRVVGLSPRLYRGQGGPDRGNVVCIFQDSRGDIWWSTSARTGNTLNRWVRDSGQMQDVTREAGLPSLTGHVPFAMAEDRDGTLWIGFEMGGIAIARRDGSFASLDPSSGIPAGRIRAIYRDVRDRLWFATSTGLWRLDGPGDPSLRFRQYTPADGLSSSTIHSLTGDGDGVIYAGTGDGVDRDLPQQFNQLTSTSSSAAI